ncbi:MAG: hypothetical protein IMX04_03470 [Candidatus Carbobacillus altaicus]|nr:hypothetical protein [Candidatus Carbobacillus altaicus]
MFKGKLNTIRTGSMLAMFLGFIFMYAGLLSKSIPFLMALLMLIGFLLVMLSGLAYFGIGYLSMRAVRIECPSCSRETKMLGKLDRCMHCGQKLTLDPHLATDLSADKDDTDLHKK